MVDLLSMDAHCTVGIAVFNALSFERTELVQCPLTVAGDANGYTQKTQDGELCALSMFRCDTVPYKGERGNHIMI